MLHKYLLAALLLTAAAPAALAQTAGSVGIGTTNPAASAALEVRSTTQGLLLPRLTLAQRDALTASTTAPPVPGLLIYLTDSTPGLYAYDGTAWVRLGADNLGNHSATQTLNLNDQRLLGSVGTSLGDSTAQVELNASVGTQSAALMTRSNFGARYSRVILSGYGKLPDGTTTANDFGIWATAYRGGGWAGFFTAAGYGANREPLRWVGICQNPGYNNTGSAIRIVDGTQGAGKVLTSDAIGYGKWVAPTITAATGDFNLGPYKLVGNGGSTGLSISNAGYVGINVAAPYSQLANTAANIIGSDGVGGNPGSLAWAASQAGYVGMFYNASTASNASGLAVKVTTTGTNAALDVSQGATQDADGTPLLRVLGNGTVGIGLNTPGGGLHVATGNSGVASGAGAILSGPPTGNPNLELRGGTAAVTPYVDFAETSGVDYSSRLLSSGGTLNVYGANATALKVNGNAVVTGSLTVNGVNVTSDRRFKTNVRPLGSALAAVLALRGVRYEWNALGVQHGGTAGASQVGLLAQEVEQVYPELVSTGPDGYKAVNYAQLTPVLIEALKEQQQQIEALQAAATRAQAELQTVKAQATAAKAQATATLDSFEARLRQLEAGTAQAQR
ncbi:tail fiber domain-containing protein [Hymenobacter persicinus]|uniref:Tail fiber domain-containing protein n=1 Tax=Hymenobacter persicinus TaxID=2025506 RepID=A0A4Q5LDP8_9BACT|nr:tail fiber domain-containing protein [Hymenobacter persicinus]RYU81321.1 tail fiber domain-containing protein [Hymenobacter persicinus]